MYFFEFLSFKISELLSFVGYFFAFFLVASETINGKHTLAVVASLHVLFASRSHLAAVLSLFSRSGGGAWLSDLDRLPPRRLTKVGVGG